VRPERFKRLVDEGECGGDGGELMPERQDLDLQGEPGPEEAMEELGRGARA